MNAPSTTPRGQYRYDPLDRLVHQTQPDMPIDQRFYCESRLATEIQGATKHSIIQHDDLLLAQQQREGDALDTTLLATDLQRSVLHTLKKGLPPRPIAYSPYGHHPVLNALLSLLGFNGERPDPVTGCYLLGNGYRAFNPVLMRFNSPDSWSPFGKGGLNSYAYCLDDPINRTDSNGHISFRALALSMRVFSRRKTIESRVYELVRTTNTEFSASILKTDQTTTLYMDSTGNTKRWQTNPTLEQTAFNAVNGRDLQLTSNTNQGHQRIINRLDQSFGKQNLSNYLEKNSQIVDSVNVNLVSSLRSAMQGKAPGVLPERALKETLSLGDGPQSFSPNQRIRRNFPNLFPDMQ
ncbi:RHS repeat-associated core domain-containing protein [Pseudomonas mohnii]|uniref:RHS repeat-associated core domain-containing protein n=1 Tax=Pseudomonas mohnii TaxID=395600 RepID=UPI0018DBA4C7|nr:RHS repeat-associated core domain-containing protein [Pseudomonas mohnii]MBH8612750.1 RHS repeat-associated core domain-containing protein [Pseudomonas mohnii]